VRKSIPRLIPLLLLAVLALAGGCDRGGTADERRTGSAPPDSVAEVIPRGSAGLHAVLPSIALVGEPVDLLVSPLSNLGTPVPAWLGKLEIESTDPALVTLTPFTNASPAAFRQSIVFRTVGWQRVTVRSDAGLEAIAGPVRVVRTEEELRIRAGEPAYRIHWGDAHGHTNLGDGANSPPSYLAYARDVAHLDYVCLSEHDFQQFLEVGLDQEPAGWDSVRTLAREFRRPGFAVLLGWEWSSREWGHRVILFPDDESRYVSFREAGTPAALAAALRGTGAISVIAHPTGSRLTPAMRWDGYVPGFDRAIEIYSGHGSMDESDFRPTSAPKPGRSALESIRRGLPLGLVAFSDTHLSTPGNPWPPEIRDAPWPGGLTAVLAPGGSEREILDAIAAGRTWASSGPRFVVGVSLNGRTMGETLEVGAGERVRLRAAAAGPHTFRSLEVMGTDRPLHRFDGGEPQIEIDLMLGPFEEDTPVWLTGIDEDGERFWTTPVRVLLAVGSQH